MLARTAVLVGAALLMGGCAALDGLAGLVQPPRFTEARDQPAEVTLQPPAAGRPFGGAVVRLWTEVTNPNAFGLTLGTLDGTLFLEGHRARPLRSRSGSPLAQGSSRLCLWSCRLASRICRGSRMSPGAPRGGNRCPIGLEGTIGVDAGRLGTPVFGPMTLLRGELRGR